MFKSLLGKFFTVYLCIILISFIIIISFSYKLIHNYLLDERLETLRKEAQIISNEYNEAIKTWDIDAKSLTRHMKYIDQYFNTRIWLFDKDGNLFFDSRPNIYNQKVNELNLINLDKNLMTNNYSNIGHFYNIFPEKMISVGVPIKMDVKNSIAVQGVIFLHAKTSSIDEKASNILTFSIIILLLTLFFAFSVIYLFTTYIISPLKTMSKAAASYSNGDFDNKIQVRSNDEIGNLAKSLNHMASELNKLEEFRRQFIANISHDFRSPLTSIIGYVNAILDGTIPKSRQDKYLEIVVTESKRLSKLTSDILLLTKIETQSLELNYSVFDIQHTLRQVTNVFEQTCKNKNIKVTILFEQNELLVYADSDKIQQIIYNLFDNATKFTEENGSIYIETNYLASQQKVSISIRNTGEIIPEDELIHIWDRFYKSDSSRGKHKGTGLGLSIVKEIIKAHGETIKITSTVNDGTEFTFTLRIKS